MRWKLEISVFENTERHCVMNYWRHTLPDVLRCLSRDTLVDVLRTMGRIDRDAAELMRDADAAAAPPDPERLSAAHERQARSLKAAALQTKVEDALYDSEDSYESRGALATRLISIILGADK